MKNLQLQKFTTHSAKGFASQHGAARRLEDMFDGIFIMTMKGKFTLKNNQAKRPFTLINKHQREEESEREIECVCEDDIYIQRYIERERQSQIDRKIDR